MPGIRSGNGKTAIRGGYGVFFEHTNGNEANAESLEPAASPAVQTTTIFNLTNYNQIVPTPAGSTTPLSMISIPNKAVWPYVQQWHLDVQHEILREHGGDGFLRRQQGHASDPGFLMLNQVLPTPLSQNPYKPGEPIGGGVDPATGDNLHDDCGTLTTPSGVPVTGQALVNLQIACGANADLFRTQFPGIGSVTALREQASSSYNALQASVRHTIGGLQLNLAYTYSHSIDDSSSARDAIILNTYDLARARASSNFDQRHQFNMGYVYDLPFFKNPGLTNKVLGGWQWSGLVTLQSGTPFSPGNGVFGDNAGVANGISSKLVSVVSRCRRRSQSGHYQLPLPGGGFGPLLYNPSAFAAPRGLTFGDMPRNFLTNPQTHQLRYGAVQAFRHHREHGIRIPSRGFQRVQPH